MISHASADTQAGRAAAERAYGHLGAIESSWQRLAAATEVLLGLVSPEFRPAADYLAGIVEVAAHDDGAEHVTDQLRVVARHFPGLELAILAVFAHVQDSAGGVDACKCPAGAGFYDGGAA